METNVNVLAVERLGSTIMELNVHNSKAVSFASSCTHRSVIYQLCMFSVVKITQHSVG